MLIIIVLIIIVIGIYYFFYRQKKNLTFIQKFQIFPAIHNIEFDKAFSEMTIQEQITRNMCVEVHDKAQRSRN